MTMIDPTVACECERWRDGAIVCPVHHTINPDRILDHILNELTSIRGFLQRIEPLISEAERLVTMSPMERLKEGLAKAAKKK